MLWISRLAMQALDNVHVQPSAPVAIGWRYIFQHISMTCRIFTRYYVCDLEQHVSSHDSNPGLFFIPRQMKSERILQLRKRTLLFSFWWIKFSFPQQSATEEHYSLMWRSTACEPDTCIPTKTAYTGILAECVNT